MTSPHDLPLISTIAAGLSFAFVCGFIASKLRLPPLVGYILAGILIGPYTPGFIADSHIAEQLSEIGVVLLLFGVGLHFSIHDFMEVRKIASAGALLRIGVIGAASVGLAAFWGWSFSTGILFGLALSVASTVVLLRTLEEQHLLSSMTGKISIGWLIVEDIAMVLALVLIPALAVQDVPPGGEQTPVYIPVAIAVGKVGVFILIMFFAGRRVLPWVLSAVSRTGSRELFTLAVFSMAMGIAFGAAVLFGVSFALGAFFAGMMIRESDLNHEVAERALPFQDAFAVLFFVAVGMIFDPRILVDEPVKVLLTLALIIVGKGLVTLVIVRGFGYPLRTAILIAVGLAQIGEFSFILIALGKDFELLSAEASNLILAGALLSIAINPLLFVTCRRICATLPADALSSDELAHLEQEEVKALNHQVIIVGHGRVGSTLTETLNKDNTDIVIIDRNRELVEDLRHRGFHAIAGDAGDAATLEEALIEKADAVVITVPDPFEARRIVEIAQKLKPSTKIVVRSHNQDETDFFKSQKVDLAVMGTDEIAWRMVWWLNKLRGKDV